MTLSQTSSRIIKQNKTLSLPHKDALMFRTYHFYGSHAMNSDCMCVVQILTYYERKEALVLASL